MINWTLSESQRRRELPVGVAYGTDPKLVLKLLREAANKHEFVLTKPEPMVYFKGFGDSSLDFELHFWVMQENNGLQISSEVAFDAMRCSTMPGSRFLSRNAICICARSTRTRLANSYRSKKSDSNPIRIGARRLDNGQFIFLSLKALLSSCFSHTLLRSRRTSLVRAGVEYNNRSPNGLAVVTLEVFRP